MFGGVVFLRGVTFLGGIIFLGEVTFLDEVTFSGEVTFLGGVTFSSGESSGSSGGGGRNNFTIQRDINLLLFYFSVWKSVTVKFSGDGARITQCSANQIAHLRAH